MTPSGLEPTEAETADLRAHPSEKQYIYVALILAAVTAAEVALYYMSLGDGLLVGLLLFFSGVKFILVALYFMHLKQDSRLLRRVFLTGITLASSVYAIVLFNFFTTD